MCQEERAYTVGTQAGETVCESTARSATRAPSGSSLTTGTMRACPSGDACTCICIMYIDIGGRTLYLYRCSCKLYFVYITIHCRKIVRIATQLRSYQFLSLSLSFFVYRSFAFFLHVRIGSDINETVWVLSLTI